ncbi:hypothetical protein PSR1_01903 [Anaeromyxobacter sp. PSR-1]|nr:hypothetical protein PSR1_01903 [Anaeromyxobacter sp. PSR-1]
MQAAAPEKEREVGQRAGGAGPAGRERRRGIGLREAWQGGGLAFVGRGRVSPLLVIRSLPLMVNPKTDLRSW